MCLYMSVPQWLNLQNFFKAINESINHTLDVSFMFIYMKCLNNRNKNNKAAIKTTKSSANHIVATQINADKNHTIDFNVNVKKRNSFEMFTLRKAYSEIGQSMQHNRQKVQQLNNQQKQQHYHNHNHYRNHYQQPQLQQEQQQLHHHHHHHYSLCNNDQLLLMDKFKTIPLHI